MGQRLNIEIKKKNEKKILANCYYHWSAYTSTSIDLGLEILENIIDYSKSKDTDKIKAIKLLQTTGAGVISEDYDLLSEEDKKYCKLSENRNLGLISISDKSMKETRQWEEGRLTIELDSNDYKDLKHFSIYSTVDFEVYYTTDLEELKLDYEEEIKKGKLDLNNIVEFDFDLTQMTKSDLMLFKSKIEEIENNYGCFKLANDKDNIYHIIY